MLNSENSLFLMTDIQDKLIQATNAEEEAINAEKLVKAANILNIPLVVSEQYPKGLGHTKQELADNFTEETKIIEKSAFSLLQEKNVPDILKSYNRKQVVLFGIEAHICVLQTAIELIENGFEVYLVKNACKSRKEYDFKAGLDFMKTKGVNIYTLETALFDLLKTSKHPKFKEVQALIK